MIASWRMMKRPGTSREHGWDESERPQRQLSDDPNVKQLRHRLQVYHQDIDVQKQQLIASQAALVESRDRYVELYEVVKASEAAKDRFLATLSHELRAPLNPVLAALTDPSLFANLPPALVETLAMMRRNIELEVDLIDDLLDLTRIARERLVIRREPVELHAAVREVLAMMQHQIRSRGLGLESKLDATASWVQGDGTRLRQVLWNLLSNAIKFTPAGGHVTVTTGNTADGALEVSVSDTGLGMDPEAVSHLFSPPGDGRPLPAPSETGLGLGLTICRGVVDAHGGRIHGSSEGSGRGSVFTVVLPCAFVAEPQPAAADASPRPRRGAPATRILLVEDDEDSVTVLRRLLTLHGYDVEVATTVAAALEASVRGFDLLISDVRLLDGSGLDLMRQLRAQRGVVRGIALSGFGSSDDVRRSTEAGYLEHLTKPVDMRRLLQAIEGCVDSAPARPVNRMRRGA